MAPKLDPNEAEPNMHASTTCRTRFASTRVCAQPLSKACPSFDSRVLSSSERSLCHPYFLISDTEGREFPTNSPSRAQMHVKIITVRQYGGEQAPASVLAPKIGPLGMSPKKVGDDIVKGTAAWKGIRITVKLTVQNRQAKVRERKTPQKASCFDVLEKRQPTEACKQQISSDQYTCSF
eukprot:3842864-Amphidinium_carterae.1